MRVVICGETSGRTRRAFAARGHDAWSCDLLPSVDNAPTHVQCEMLLFLRLMRGYFDLAIFHPTCQYLSSSGLHWNKRGKIEADGRPRAEHTKDAIRFAIACMSQDIPHIAMENPIGCLSTQYRKPDQIIQPYHFGDDASKATCLWLKNLPPLRIDPSRRLPGRKVVWNGKIVERWSNQCDSGQNKLGPSDDRWSERSETYPGIAQAFAENWG